MLLLFTTARHWLHGSKTDRLHYILLAYQTALYRGDINITALIEGAWPSPFKRIFCVGKKSEIKISKYVHTLTSEMVRPNVLRIASNHDD